MINKCIDMKCDGWPHCRTIKVWRVFNQNPHNPTFVQTIWFLDFATIIIFNRTSYFYWKNLCFRNAFVGFYLYKICSSDYVHMYSKNKLILPVHAIFFAVSKTYKTQMQQIKKKKKTASSFLRCRKKTV
jgi:hypothetical protein